jgi:lipooligosaccharide transport system permease protein
MTGASVTGDAAPAPPPAQPTRKLRRFERSAVGGVLIREMINFSSYWRSTTFSSTVEPTIYLLAFGFGLGSLIDSVGNGISYEEFVGTGMVAMAVLFSSAMPSMFGTFVKYSFQHTYDAILAAPVDTEELVSAEALWMAMRASVFGCAPLLVAIAFGLPPSWGMLAVPFINFLAGFGWSCFGISIAAFVKSIDNFGYITSAVITPLFLVAGTFFPIDQLPEWAQVLAQVNPLYHCVELVRHAAFGFEGWSDVWNVTYLIGFGLIMWRVAIRGMTKKLVN